MTPPRNINRCTPCLEGDHRRCTGSAGNIGCGCIHNAPVPRPLRVLPEPADHEERMDIARRTAYWYIGDEGWADTILDAYREDPTVAEARLAAEMDS